MPDPDKPTEEPAEQSEPVVPALRSAPASRTKQSHRQRMLFRLIAVAEVAVGVVWACLIFGTEGQFEDWEVFSVWAMKAVFCTFALVILGLALLHASAKTDDD